MLRKSEKICCKLGKKAIRALCPKNIFYISGQFFGGVGGGGVKVSLSTAESLSKSYLYFSHVMPDWLLEKLPKFDKINFVTA
jgi:hypothetical protein